MKHSKNLRDEEKQSSKSNVGNVVNYNNKYKLPRLQIYLLIIYNYQIHA